MKKFTKQNLTKEERLFLNKAVRGFFNGIYEYLTGYDKDTENIYNNFMYVSGEDYIVNYSMISLDFLTKFYNKQLRKLLSLDEDDEIPTTYEELEEYIYESLHDHDLESINEPSIDKTITELTDIMIDIADKITHEPSFKLGAFSLDSSVLWFIPKYGYINLKKRDYKNSISNIEELLLLEQTDYPTYTVKGIISQDMLYLVSDEQYDRILEEKEE